MAAVKIFVSFDIENDEVEKQLFEGGMIQSCLTLKLLAWSAPSSIKPSRWQAIVKDKINLCQLLIVLSGKHMATATNVSQEIAMARALSVPVFGVYISGAGRGDVLPEGLALSRTIEREWSRIDEAIRLALREGRNNPRPLASVSRYQKAVSCQKNLGQKC
ncbi:TIR domain-containing protein [Oceanicoccus sagamiensis]|uniref:Thoeris protein ThsB TIR-like domain-containing protein n=1 Tax=Oceanicoccus sagamiensis TaxID=716816 RepID=A0A1X9NE21_9GAMM|nr:TIR domain-containing protein [Oceanicoccus sagamiensis]ARN75304.1 hypothetical protein BST96_14985 [Oceanicoccus sagamiensis]